MKWESVNWIKLAQDGLHCGAVVSAVISEHQRGNNVQVSNLCLP
jgi:hypothetical protein